MPQMPRIRSRLRPFHLNGLRFHYDANSGQKTGAFLDQRENYVAAARYAKARRSTSAPTRADLPCILRVSAKGHRHRCLPCRARGGGGEPAVEPRIATRRSVDWVEANAFDLLRDWSTAGPAYDTIVLDPPAFAKSKRAVEGALRGYKELNLRAMKMLRPGGTLVTCSCSHHVSSEEFTPSSPLPQEMPNAASACWNAAEPRPTTPSNSLSRRRNISSA